MKKRDLFYTVGRNINLYSHCREQYGGFLKKKNPGIELPYYPAIPLLGIYLDKSIIPKDTYTVFTVALFAIARTGSNLNVQRNE